MAIFRNSLHTLGNAGDAGDVFVIDTTISPAAGATAGAAAGWSDGALTTAIRPESGGEAIGVIAPLEVGFAAAPGDPTAAAGNNAPVIYEIYGGGGSASGTWQSDYIVLHNPTGAAIPLTGWSVQYASAAGTSWSVTALTGSIPAGGYYLVKESTGAGLAPLPVTADATGTIAMAAGAGKVALVNSTTALTAAAFTGTSPTGAQIVDFVGYGATATQYEGTGPAPAPSATSSIVRSNFGNTDTNVNSTDFGVDTAPTPEFTNSTPHPADLTPQLSINDVVVTEGDSGTTVATFTVTLSQPAGVGGVTFDIATADGTALAGSDYTAHTLTSQTIAEGSTTYTFTVDVTGDTTFEANETAFVNVTNVTGATVSDGQGQLTITNDDASPTPLLSINDVAITEGDAGTKVATFTVTLTQPAGAGGVTFDIATADGTATAGSDYVAHSQTGLTIAAGQSTATFSVTINGDTTFEPNETAFVNVTNVTGATVTDGQGQLTITNDDYTPIFVIQGSTHISPLNGQAVTTRGVVTGVVTTGSARGYYIQDQVGDGNANTSDAVLVFTGTTTPTVSVGQLVEVSGTVSEFRAAGALSLTEIINSSAPVVISSGNLLPDAVVLGAGGRMPPGVLLGDNDVTGSFDPANQATDFYETLEGMRVTVPDAISTSAYKNSNGEVWVRSGAIATDNLNSRGGLTITDTTPGVADPSSKIFDFNPERIKLNDTISSLPTINAVGDKLGDVTGVLSYNFGSYEVLPTSPVSVVTPSTLAKETTTIAASLDTVRVATFNVRNFAPLGFQDGEFATGHTTTQAEINTRAQAIISRLGSPDIIALQEVQDNNGITNDSVTDASTTLQQLIDAIVALGGPHYKAIDSNPADDQDGGVPGGNIRTAFLYNPDAVSPSAANGLVQDAQPDVYEFNPANRIGVGNSDFSATRKSLPIEWLPAGYTSTEGGSFYVIDNHLSSKGGSTTLTGTDLGNPYYGEPVNSDAVKREGQAIALNAYIDAILGDANPLNDKIVALGDFNDFQFFPVVQLATGQLVRATVGTGNTDSTFNPGTPVLRNLAELLSAVERYSYNFEGNAQALDQVLATPNLYASALYDIVHINSEFADQISDHDPGVTSLVFLRSAALATAGDDVLDQAAYTARFGATRGSLAGADVMHGLDGGDIIVGDGGDDALFGDAGDDHLYGRSGADTLDGGDGADDLVGGDGADTLIGGAGIDTAWYYSPPFGGGSVTVDMLNGANSTGDAAGDTFNSVERVVLTNGDDVLYGTNNTDYILGAGGDDLLIGRGGGDVFDGGDGIDAVQYDNPAGDARLLVDLLNPYLGTGEAALDQFFNIEKLIGTDGGADGLWGSNGDDFLIGRGGNDDLIGRGGADTYDGGAGFDTVWFEQSARPGTFLVIDLGDTALSTGEATGDTYISIERFVGTVGQEYLFGSVGDDAFSGFDGDDAMEGRDGSDKLDGGAGSDRIAGGAGRDTMVGGSGADAFVYFAASDGGGGGDRIVDFVSGEDRLEFVASGFGLDKAAIPGDVFVNGTTATGAHAQFLWDAASHTLMFDADGTGSAAAVTLLATFDNSTVTAGDLLFV